MNPIVEIQNLSFTYPTSIEVTLSIPSMVIEKGQHSFIYGPSGCGKTTLLSILCGIQADYSGSVKVLGTELRTLPSHQRDRFRSHHIGYIFQMFNLISYLSVVENIYLPLKFNPKESLLDGAPEKINLLLHQLEINQLSDKPVSQLSVGQQQRVAAARALISEPEIIIADEPTSALDAKNRDQFMNLMQKSCEETQSTLIFVSHDQSLASSFHQKLSLKEAIDKETSS